MRFYRDRDPARPFRSTGSSRSRQARRRRARGRLALAAVAAALLLAVGAPLALVACSESRPTTPTTLRFDVSGTVREAAASSSAAAGIEPADPGDALDGAQVEILDGPDAGKSTTTGEDGSYSLADVAAGPVTIRASKGGFAPLSKEVSVEADTTVDFELQDTTSTLSGRVTETAPTEDVALSGAVVEVVGGPHDGKSDTTDEDGRYEIDELEGQVTVRASKEGYEPRQEDFVLGQDKERDFALDPIEEQVEEVFRDSISGGTPTRCDDKPCETFQVAVHHDGTLEAELTWTDSSNDLDLELRRDGEMLASSDGVLTMREFISSEVLGGHFYELRVIYFNGATIEEFELTVTHPS